MTGGKWDTLTRKLNQPDVTMGWAAAQYALAGIQIFPLHWITRNYRNILVCACRQAAQCKSPGKHPIVRHGVEEASNNVAKVATWWQQWPHANIGLAANHNRLAIIDVDPRHDGDHSLAVLDQWAVRRGADMVNTHTVRTPSGGLHYYYHAPPGGIKTAANTFGANGTGLDTRGVGGYVVAPPSMGLPGRYEHVIDSGEPAVWPDCLTQAIDMAYPERKPISPLARNAPPQPPPTASRQHGWGLAALTGECTAVAQTEEGGRSDRLNKAAYKLGGIVASGHLTTEQVTEHLTAAAITCGLTALEASGTISSGLRAGKQKPRTPAPVTPL
jgi:hypothetical protein